MSAINKSEHIQMNNEEACIEESKQPQSILNDDEMGTGITMSS